MRIKVENVTKKIGQATVLDQINMELESGIIYGLKGKSLFHSICMLYFDSVFLGILPD